MFKPSNWLLLLLNWLLLQVNFWRFLGIFFYFLFFWFRENWIYWLCVFHFFSLWVHSNVSYCISVLEKWEHYACLCPWVCVSLGRQWGVQGWSSLTYMWLPDLCVHTPAGAFPIHEKSMSDDCILLMMLLRRKERIELHPNMNILHILEGGFEWFLWYSLNREELALGSPCIEFWRIERERNVKYLQVLK